MGGGLMQLVAYGAQDIYLTGNPQITFFKVVYRRHTNFAMESVQQTLSGTAGFGSKVTAVVSRNGDLVGRMYVECDPSAVIKGTAFAPNPLHQLLKEMTVEIGGQQIDKQYGHWLNVWTELTEPTNVSIIDNNGQYAAAVTTRGTDTEARVPPTPYQRMSFGVKAAGIEVTCGVLEPEAIKYHPNGITTEGVFPAKELPLPPSVGYLARLCPLKGLDILVDAFIGLKESGKHEHLHLKIAGGMTDEDVPFVEEQKSKLLRAGLNHCFSITPNISREEKFSFLNFLML